MNKLIAGALVLAFVCTLSIGSANAQVGIDVGGSASGSAGSDQGASVDAGVDASVSSDEEDAPDSSDTNVSVSLTQDDVASASIDAASAELGSVGVSTSDDLSTFATAKMKRDVNIESIDASNDRISIEYRQNAHFLGFIPGSIRTTAEVHVDGTVDVDYPWYRFLFAVENSDTIEAELQARAQEVMAGAGGTLTARLEAELLDVMHGTLAGEVDATTGSATTADMAGQEDASASSEADASGDASGEVYPQ